jgi:hypothetical protein
VFLLSENCNLNDNSYLPIHPATKTPAAIKTIYKACCNVDEKNVRGQAMDFRKPKSGREDPKGQKKHARTHTKCKVTPVQRSLDNNF